MSGSESPFHAGELAVQTRAGVADTAQRVGRSIGRRLEERREEFLATQRVAVLAGADDQGRSGLRRCSANRASRARQATTR
jgi:predicted pyridoxine 5'-phosphate oxidase superfamily flavin-nucleotide-binding protein